MPIQSTHPLYDARIGMWSKCRAAMEGEQAIKDAGVEFLPMLSGHHNGEEGLKSYRAYKERALWFGATSRTVEGYVGAIMRNEPTFKVPSCIASRLKNIDNGGQSAAELVHDTVKELMITGRGGYLVDAIGTDDANVPYIKLYAAEDIYNWMIDEHGTLVFVTLHEVVDAADPGDPFKVTLVEQLRLLHLSEDGYTQTIYRKVSGKTDEWAPIKTVALKSSGNSIGEIPFVFFSTERRNTACPKPPILDLVSTNINLYQLDADWRHGLHFTALPTAVFTGADAKSTYYLGSETAICLSNEQAKAFYLEFQGIGLGSIKDAITERKMQLAAIGAKLIAHDKGGKGVETAEAARIQHSGETATLATIVTRAEEALEAALRMAARWMSPAEPDVDVVINREFVDAAISAEEIRALTEALQGGTLTASELFWNFKRGGIIRPKTEEAEYLAQLEKEAAQRQERAMAAQRRIVDGSKDDSVGGEEAPGAGGGAGNTPKAQNAANKDEQ